MRFNPIPLIAAVLLLLSLSLSAQDNSRYNLLLRSGSFIPEKNIVAEKIDQFNNAASRSAGKIFAVIQFEEIPGASQIAQLKQQGIELLEYIPHNAYTVSVSGNLDVELLKQVNARAVIGLSPLQKMQPELAMKKYPSWAIRSAGTIDLWISFPGTFSFEWVQQELQRKNFEIVSTLHKNYRIIVLRTPINRIEELAGFSFIEFVQPAPAEDKALNTNSMAASRANVLKAPAAFGGNDLNGQGVVVGIGEDGDVQTHLDFTGRLINRAGERPRAHATHVTGTVGGGGIIQELYTGYANKSILIGQVFSNVYTYAPAYVADHGMVITNNSYGSVTDDCAYNGLYDLTARVLDQQAFDLPELIHVFAAGNDGSETCSPYPGGFKTVLGGYQSAKNVLVVGSTDYKNDWSGFSSRGPVRDGRLKPEIMAQGDFVPSTWTNNLYSYNTGTSMACPGVSGGLALLVQRYRQLNAGANPTNGLLKAIACNGSSDRGNAGPDFSYGFGSMNLLRSVRIIESASYFNSSVIQGNTNTHTINIPANTAKLKVMLYWQDPPAAVMASKTLVNDLDLEVTGPGGTVLPFRLDTLSSNVNNPATSGVDNMNNIEQVVIENPASGSYDLRSIGTTIAQGPSQSYHLVYDIIPQSLVLTNPVGGERLVPTTTILDTFYIHWDSYSDETNPFTLEFSSNNGASWTTINNNIPASSRIYSWPVPNIPTDQARIRLSKNNTAFTQTSAAFTITEWAAVSLDATQCEGYIRINWGTVPGATDYEVMMLQGDEMVSVTTTTALTYTFSGLSKDLVYWVTVRPRINGNPGRRAAAISRQPDSGTCAGNISDNDLKVDSIISPSSSGRVFTSTTLSNSIPVTIRIKNLDDAVSSGNINVSYSINGGAPVAEVITSPTADIAAGGFIDHTFATNADLSAVGTYSFEVIATKASDPVTANNNLTKVFKQLDNQPITNVDLPWLDNFESASEQTVSANQMGLSGRDRYDFVKSTIYGRLRTHINSGMSYSGNRAVTLDMSRYQAAGNVDSLTGTFNLGTFNAATDDIRLDFRYKNHNQQSNAANRVWIRGSDAGNWIEMYNLFANQNEADGSYKLSSSLQLADSLTAHGQSFSSSFQVRWGQWGQYMAADNDGGAGYTFDDIRIYRAIDDVQMISIDTPTTVACNLNNTVPVIVTVRNTSDAAVTNVPVVLRVDGIIVAAESIPSVAANSLLQYTFSPGVADLSGPGNHTVEVWVAYATDNVRDNDTARITARSLPLINSFPYLEDFEAGDGTWHTSAQVNSTWEYGTPVSAKINRAASGTKAWKTNRAGYYNDSEFSYLYSPCFNLSAMTNPSLSFSLALDIEDCGAVLCDAAWMEYSTDGGQTWTKLGASGQGTNWYNKNYSGNHVWSQQDYTRWHVATIPLPTSNNSSLRLRFVFNSDPGLSKDGIAVDDIHIYDNLYGIYDVTGTSPVVNQTLNGSGWIDFIESGTNKLIASVNPNGENMGSTDVQSYVHTGAVRINSDQFYHNRNITIKPTTVNLTDSATVRFYFLDSETEALINATGCIYCYKPAMAYNLGVTKYSDADDNMENGTLADNTPGNYIFIPTSKIRMVPFDKGYYAEYKVKDFSEFWLNNGGFDNNTPLPVQLLSFTAQKVNLSKDVLVEWKTVDEINVSHFEIELAKGNNGLQQDQFMKLGEVIANGNSTQQNYYRFTDTENNKSGIRYYRLKIIDNDGSFKYSAVRPLLFDKEIQWQVNPNPSAGIFSLVFQASSGQTINLQVYDLTGRLVKQQQTIANGFVQKVNIDLEGPRFANGLYLLHADDGSSKQVFRLVRE